MAYEPQGRVEDFTNAFLVTVGLLLFMTLWVLTALLGFLWVITISYGIDHLFRWLGRMRRTS